MNLISKSQIATSTSKIVNKSALNLEQNKLNNMTPAEQVRYIKSLVANSAINVPHEEEVVSKADLQESELTFTSDTLGSKPRTLEEAKAEYRENSVFLNLVTTGPVDPETGDTLTATIPTGTGLPVDFIAYDCFNAVPKNIPQDKRGKVNLTTFKTQLPKRAHALINEIGEAMKNSNSRGTKAIVYHLAQPISNFEITDENGNPLELPEYVLVKLPNGKTKKVRLTITTEANLALEVNIPNRDTSEEKANIIAECDALYD